MAKGGALPLLGGAEPLSVSKLCAQLKRTLEGLGQVCVQGELSGGKLYGSGHFYVSLKDDGGVIPCTMWRDAVAVHMAQYSSQFGGRMPPDGTLVVAYGRATYYGPSGKAQLVIESLEPAGLGALMQRLEALKAKLAAEGLFDAARKKTLPFLPAKIGIITSPSGAVFADMLHRIEARCPRQVVLWPVAVQGPTAALEVAAAVQGFNALPKHQQPDVLIVARGGGSFEDLMAFNDEAVVRAVAASVIPVLSGVGHEPDITLCDFAADVRAPTPTAAAEMAVPVRADILASLAMYNSRLATLMDSLLNRYTERLTYLGRLLPQPTKLLENAVQRLDEVHERLLRSLPTQLVNYDNSLEHTSRMLAALNPALPLKRGYVWITDANGTVITSAHTPEVYVKLRFADGERAATLKENADA
jgi:exodeoxyribonuclease VII large subunit